MWSARLWLLPNQLLRNIFWKFAAGPKGPAPAQLNFDFEDVLELLLFQLLQQEFEGLAVGLADLRELNPNAPIDRSMFDFAFQGQVMVGDQYTASNCETYPSSVTS